VNIWNSDIMAAGWSRSLCGKLVVAQLVKKYITFYGTRCSLLHSLDPGPGWIHWISEMIALWDPCWGNYV